ncbi:UNVERIFIED_CONTAM: hypothetical protein Scaly_1021500 [Sesamum calycinum]|uniref:Reverse transcriptase zinc-binding domain-containing protein n=1 Tax=Sesamum calycinum TaxID=2727403 RepID=A0AAW2QJX5_9LAMI
MVVNLEKLEIEFSRNIPKRQKEDLALLEVRVVEKSVDTSVAVVLGHHCSKYTAPRCHSSQTIGLAGKWKEGLIQEVFQNEDVEAILGINEDIAHPDQLRWHYEKNNWYTVKIAYRLFSQGLVMCAAGGRTGSTSYKPVNWKFIWKTKVPPKVRMFVWRACWNSLHTVVNLAKQGVKVGGVCPRCGLENEDVLHCLLHCHFAHLVWATSNLPWAYTSCDHSNLEASFRGMSHALDSPAFARALLLCWFLWGSRNRLLFEKLALSPFAIIEQVRSWEKALAQKHDNLNSLVSSLMDVGGSHSNPTGIG